MQPAVLHTGHDVEQEFQRELFQQQREPADPPRPGLKGLLPADQLGLHMPHGLPLLQYLLLASFRQAQGSEIGGDFGIVQPVPQRQEVDQPVFDAFIEIQQAVPVEHGAHLLQDLALARCQGQ